MILGIEVPHQIGNAHGVGQSVHEDGGDDGAGLAVAPAQAEGGWQILQEAQQKMQRGIGSDVAHHMDQAEQNHGNQIRSDLVFAVEIPEDESTEEQFLHNGHQKYGAPDDQLGILPKHGGDAGVVDVGEAGINQ